MAKYIFKRILTAIPLIIVITILCFSLIHLAPYDAIDAMTTPKMSPEIVQMIRENTAMISRSTCSIFAGWREF